MRNLKLILEYDGSDFCGWQVQPNTRTVQGEVEQALQRLTGDFIRVITAGRTDSGVHAQGQVANFLTSSRLSLQVFLRGGNAMLPMDVRILAVEEVPLDFNARFSARQRSYRYTLTTRPRAIGRNFAWQVPFPLDLAAMQKACEVLLGEQDFQAFCQTGADVSHYRCHLNAAEWKAVDDTIVFYVRANRFLHNMVRILVGTCVEIGRGRWQAQDMARILASRDRRLAGPTAPAHGLVLEAVDYEGDFLIEPKPLDQLAGIYPIDPGIILDQPIE